MKKNYQKKEFNNPNRKGNSVNRIIFKSKKPISKDKILSKVWNYSSDADTHTVETHIYRLRKKLLINSWMINLFLIIKMDIICEKKK